MAELAAILATTHHPFFYATSRLPPERAPPFAAEWVRKVGAYRETLTRARPDVLVMVGSDHFHQLWLDNMPQFLVGKAPFYDASYYNEEREFGLPRLLLRGHEELSAHILRSGIDAGFDLAFTNCGSTTPSRARSSPSAPATTCRWCRCTPTSSRRRCPGPNGSWPSAASRRHPQRHRRIRWPAQPAVRTPRVPALTGSTSTTRRRVPALSPASWRGSPTPATTTRPRRTPAAGLSRSSTRT